jgi:RNase H-fold protein (predicted Holliday junction resolvase)
MPVYFEKEAFTSVHARQASGKEGRVDSHAAALILQRYMDRAQVTQNKASDTIDL